MTGRSCALLVAAAAVAWSCASSGTVIHTVKVGGEPEGVEISPDGRS